MSETSQPGASVAIANLSVSFDGFRAVDDVSLHMIEGQVHFLIGPNGAGKTTLVDALTGLVPATGSAMYNGNDLLTMKTNKIIRAGVGRTFQTATVFDELTVLQNLDIAGGLHRKAWRLPFARRTTPESVDVALETIGLTGARDKPAGILAHGQKQWLEIGMMLVQDAKVMFLDEPVAGMNADERDETGMLLRRIGDERTIIVIEHDMEFVRSYAEWVTVMHGGKLLTAGTVEHVQADKRVQEVYLGSTEDAAVEGKVVADA
ncbi:urea ABC transporter ATP-binding protein UrtD [Salinibacterium sp. dk2585]|uniref:urea ABC transporter ATP-binding protein UrtD n=1 Tax=unclassified Salinibacterium TaxID=2632331 RepID=UPI0011C24DA6|nr:MULTISPECIES: urea ABC transporter ATP-binding protein UrtD [unclassified Salinibacterium]QEE62039.1 urea ABC transporter ATP-binding protein UrtD [Salinibacterium sp. dk2585]TXK52215.1 urea ABC transporter ATP-binding protein UrtD [Salinibacterium sp. dk5596]